VQTASGLEWWNWWDTGAGATVAKEPEPGLVSGTEVPEPMWDRGTGLSHLTTVVALQIALQRRLAKHTFGSKKGQRQVECC
jgi:hypothetical protein